jgi:isopentenyldiphosphate isomerase
MFTVSDERYDFYDQNGKKIGVANWKELHTKGLIHENVQGILFKDNSKSQVLLKRRSSNVDMEPNTIEIAVGGHVLSGESSEDGLKRELNEELFWEKDLPKNLTIRKICKYFNHDVENNYENAYLFEIIYSGPFFHEKDYSDKPFWRDWKTVLKDINNNSKEFSRYSINAIKEYLKAVNDL